MALIDDITKEAKKFFDGESGSHNWEHTQRVIRLSKHIGKIEGANLEILELAAILHDICKPEEFKKMGAICHAEKGAILAKQILTKYKVPQEKINAVVHCIEVHRKTQNKKPETIEAKILFDADKIDSLGATGIGRSFMAASEIKSKFHNDKKTREKIQETKEYTAEDTAYREFATTIGQIQGRLHTSEAKRLAKERYAFMEEFFSRLNKETDGKI